MNSTKKENELKKRKSPVDLFFSLGNRITKGDPVRKASFDYFLMWIIFLAFISIFIGNVWRFIQNPNLVSLGWAAFIIGILWFQYNGLVQFYGIRKMMRTQRAQRDEPKEEIKIESFNEMMESFKE